MSRLLFDDDLRLPFTLETLVDDTAMDADFLLLADAFLDDVVSGEPFTLNLLDRFPEYTPCNSLTPDHPDPTFLDLALSTAAPPPEADPADAFGLGFDLEEDAWGLDAVEEIRDLFIDAEWDEYDGEPLWQTMEAEVGEADEWTTPTARTALDQLPSVVVAAEEEGKVVCSVCKEDVPPGGWVTQLPCSHRYHEDCILPWLLKQNTCPMCRYVLPLEEEEEEEDDDDDDDEIHDQDFWFESDLEEICIQSMVFEDL